ncbi:MAG: hypothetical protein ACREF0_11390 [Acetobacteraceae bacterium]
MLPVYGLVSSYREGHLVTVAVESLLRFCDKVFCLEGPVGNVDEWAKLVTGGGEEAGYESEYPKNKHRVFVRHGKGWASDAVKRTDLVRWVQSFDGGPAWGIILDGDETWIWAEHMRDYLVRSESTHVLGGVKFKLCFEDGQVYETAARTLRVDAIDEYVLSSYQIRLKGMATVWTSPIIPARVPPLQGEPHILHRGYLRPPKRNEAALRLSTHELDDLVALGIGQPSPEGPLRISVAPKRVIIPGE